MMIELKLVNARSGKNESLGMFASIQDLSEAFPITASGKDKALAGKNPKNWEVVCFLTLLNGSRKEITDPRIFLEDMVPHYLLMA